MRAYILVALSVILTAVVTAEDVEERGFSRMQRCRSDRHCRRGVCCKGWCRTMCPKRCKSDGDCQKGECCRGYCRRMCINKRCKSDGDCKKGECCRGVCRRMCINKRCKSDGDCKKGECCRGVCRTYCIKQCKSEDDCKEGQCCLKYGYHLRLCRAYKQEGEKCYKKSNGNGHLIKRDCGCAEGLECQVSKAFFFGYHGFRPGKCASEEGSGDM